jgi:hypothetical protein
VVPNTGLKALVCSAREDVRLMENSLTTSIGHCA